MHIIHWFAPRFTLTPDDTLEVRSNGRSIQYHGQIGKEEGKELYEALVDFTFALVAESQCHARKEKIPVVVSGLLSGVKAKQTDPSIPPHEMFRTSPLYSEWNAEGLPTKDAKQEPLSQSALKKLKKQLLSQKQRYEKYLQKGEGADSQRSKKVPSIDWPTLVDMSYIAVLAGTFGALQGLELTSDMGPFCHVVSIS